ncbi:hypothetical protein QFZ67_002039 [Streptomyces sp. V1I1]|nr:hypothetical protein [Streptomyces sp. V1I1]
MPHLSEAERDLGRREPQVALGQLAGFIDRPRRRIDGPIGGPQFTDPVLEHGQAPVPAQAFGDHCRRHLRPLLEQFADLRLDDVDDRAL